MTTVSRPSSLSHGPVRMDKRDGATAPPTRLPGRRQVADGGADGVEANFALYMEGKPVSLQARQYPERQRARSAVTYALKTGKLAKPLFCQRCFAVRKLSAHHSNYKKPLKVTWLCYPCHTHIHYRTQKNNPVKTWQWSISATANDIADAWRNARAGSS